MTKQGSVLIKAAQSFGNLLFPPKCGVCDELTERAGGICGECWQHLNFIGDPHCYSCGYPLEYAMGEGAQCASCLEFPPKFRAHRSALVFDEFSKKLVHDLKFYDKSLMLANMGQWMAQASHALPLKESRLPPLLVPIPLHRWRLWRRKYNQAALLAKAISLSNEWEVGFDVLLRTKLRPPQAGLSRKQRLVNLRGSFEVNPKYNDLLKGRNIILVDDVMTTGATLNACAKLLKSEGASGIFALTLARTVLGE